ncbi:endonuclease domain-containing protein [Micromonospora fluostatini]|uniref:endonuclease domain-containing protein n=1 Tax=Micromonospora sp. JCM 30529 TaxID=3421643 RepID=UPI003D17CF1E
MTLARDLAGLPTDRVVHLGGPTVEVVAETAARCLTDHAAVVLDPGSGGPLDVVRTTLDRLEQVAYALLPGWLPEAAQVGRTDPLSLAAVRAAATGRARGSRHSAAFLTHLATAALTGRRPRGDAFALEQRCLGLARVVAEGFDRSGLVLLVDLPADPTEQAEQALVAAAEWLAQHGRLGVWLVGGALRVDRVPVVHLARPGPVATGPAGGGTPGRSAPPPVVGRPHPASAAEAALEAALAAESWAAGRRWNQSYQSDVLTAPVRLDLVWPAERCVVEVDGPEHCHPARFEADRQRDVRLQLDGYAVLRFTNARISHDVGSVVHQIGTYLRDRRRAMAEGRFHARR